MGYNGRRQNSVCFGCPYRTATCHADCEIHRAERARNRAEREERLATSIGQRAVCEYQYAKRTRAIRHTEDARRK